MPCVCILRDCNECVFLLLQSKITKVVQSEIIFIDLYVLMKILNTRTNWLVLVMLLGLKTDRNGRENPSPISVAIFFDREWERDRNDRERKQDRNIRDHGNRQI